MTSAASFPSRRAHLLRSMASKVLVPTRSLHTFMELLLLPETAASPAILPGPGPASSTLP